MSETAPGRQKKASYFNTKIPKASAPEVSNASDWESRGSQR